MSEEIEIVSATIIFEKYSPYFKKYGIFLFPSTDFLITFDKMLKEIIENE